MSTGTIVRSLVVQVHGGQLLLPSALVSEVLAYREPEPAHDDKPWLEGMLRWRGEEIPLVSFEKVLGIHAEEAPSRMIICYGIYATDALPFYALLAKTLPHSVSVGADMLSSPKAVKRKGVLASVTLGERTAWLPDLEYLEKLFQEAL